MSLIKIIGDDPFDPNNWVEDDREHRIYADETCEVYAVVDWIDYIYLNQFKWCVHTTHVSRSLARSQLYLRRTIPEFLAPDGVPYISEFTGKLVRNRKRITRTLFLHMEVMMRKGDVPPTDKHTLVDHEDRDSMHCRRANLRWATHKENGNNRSKDGVHFRSNQEET